MKDEDNEYTLKNASFKYQVKIGERHKWSVGESIEGLNDYVWTSSKSYDDLFHGDEELKKSLLSEVEGIGSWNRLREIWCDNGDFFTKIGLFLHQFCDLPVVVEHKEKNLFRIVKICGKSKGKIKEEQMIRIESESTESPGGGLESLSIDWPFKIEKSSVENTEYSQVIEKIKEKRSVEAKERDVIHVPSTHQLRKLRSQCKVLEEPFVVEDAEKAKIPQACAVYACAVICKKPFAYMKKWFREHTKWNGKSGVETPVILECLTKHGVEYSDAPHGQGQYLNSCMDCFLCNTYYLLVYSNHVNVYFNGQVNERFYGGWVSTKTQFRSDDGKKKRNRKILQIYMIKKRV